MILARDDHQKSSFKLTIFIDIVSSRSIAVCFLSARVTKSLTECLMKTPQHEREVYLVISDIVVKGLQERCVDISDKFFAITKRGNHDHAFKVMDDRGQLGQLQRDIVAQLWLLQKPISVQGLCCCYPYSPGVNC